MNIESLFVENPRLEWHNNMPFVLAKLDKGYAHFLADLALEYEPHILTLPVHPKWARLMEQNPTGSRYSSYNTFLLHSSYMPLFGALKKTYDFYLEALQKSRRPTYLQSWLNIHRKNQKLSRHQHQAPVIGSFLARAEGSTTRYGLSKEISTDDQIFSNEDGVLLMTSGPGHYHEVSTWQNQDKPRVSYAFDIVDAVAWRSDKVLIPFDSLSDSTSQIQVSCDMI